MVGLQAKRNANLGHKAISTHTLVLLVTLAVGASALGRAENDATSSADANAAVDEFVSKEDALWQQRRQDHITSDEFGEKYMALLKSEAERLRRMMPDILDVIGERLRYRSESDKRNDALPDPRPSATQAPQERVFQSQPNVKEAGIARCDLVSLAAFLGRSTPKEAVEVMLSSGPPPEEADDWCYIKALMTIGPPGYKPILEKISTQKELPPVYYGVMALVSSAADTDFPIQAGLGKENSWDRTLPKPRRGLLRLSKKWEKWWNTNENRFTWNPETGLLVAK